MKEKILMRRETMKSYFGEMEDVQSDQQLGKPLPQLQKPCEENAKVISLPKPEQMQNTDLTSAIQNRRSIGNSKKSSLL